MMFKRNFYIILGYMLSFLYELLAEMTKFIDAYGGFGDDVEKQMWKNDFRNLLNLSNKNTNHGRPTNSQMPVQNRDSHVGEMNIVISISQTELCI